MVPIFSDPPGKYRSKYRKRKYRRKKMDFTKAATITALDVGVGRVYDALKKERKTYFISSQDKLNTSDLIGKKY